MNRKILVVAGIISIVLAVVGGAAACLAGRLSVSHECRVDFLYEYGKPHPREDGLRGELLREAEDGNRCAKHAEVCEDLKRVLSFLASNDGFSLCQRHIALQGESVARIRTVLASARLDVVGMPCTNFVYPCRLVLADGDKRNLMAFARFCMNRVKEQVDEENRIRIHKATISEYMVMRKAERRVKELERQVVNGEGNHSIEHELRMAQETVGEMNRRIEEIGKSVMLRGGRYIIFESPPEVSWVLRRKEEPYCR